MKAKSGKDAGRGKGVELRVGQSEVKQGGEKESFKLSWWEILIVGIVVANMSGVNDNVGGGPDQVTRLT